MPPPPLLPRPFPPRRSLPPPLMSGVPARVGISFRRRRELSLAASVWHADRTVHRRGIEAERDHLSRCACLPLPIPATFGGGCTAAACELAPSAAFDQPSPRVVRRDWKLGRGNRRIQSRHVHRAQRTRRRAGGNRRLNHRWFRNIRQVRFAGRRAGATTSIAGAAVLSAALRRRCGRDHVRRHRGSFSCDGVCVSAASGTGRRNRRHGHQVRHRHVVGQLDLAGRDDGLAEIVGRRRNRNDPLLGVLRFALLLGFRRRGSAAGIDFRQVFGDAVIGDLAVVEWADAS